MIDIHDLVSEGTNCRSVPAVFEMAGDGGDEEDRIPSLQAHRGDSPPHRVFGCIRRLEVLPERRDTPFPRRYTRISTDFRVLTAVYSPVFTLVMYRQCKF